MSASSFMDRIKSDEALRGHVQQAGGTADRDEALARLVSIAEGEGITFTVSDFEQELDRRVGALSDEQLDSVAGGLLLPAVNGGRDMTVAQIIGILIAR